jgi:triphosphoribosyl-dephospho-CoA synthetase
MYPQGTFTDQANINKAIYIAMEKMHSDIIRTSASNQALFEHVGILRGRMQTLEQENTQLRALVDGLRGGKRQAPKLNLAISNLDLNDKPGLPTPSTVCA